MCQPISSINIANETDILEEILQSIIDFENNPTKSQSDKVFKKYITYLDKEIGYETSKELFSLILSCFLHFPDQPTVFFQEIISKSRINSNRIIITASIFSHLNDFKDQFLFSQYKNFVIDSITQIIPQIRKDKSDKNDFFFVFEKKIHQKFIPSFIIDILLSIKLKEKSFLSFCPYIFRHHKMISHNQMTRFIQKVVKSGLAPFFPGEFLSDECFFNYFSMNTLSLIIPNLSENIFRQVLPQIETQFSEETWTRQFSISILDKIINLNIKIKSINNILHSISPADITIKVWEYLANFDFLLPKKLASKIKKFPNPVSSLKVMTVFNNIPLNIFFHGLFKTHDLNVFERIFDSEIYIIKHDVFSKIFSTSKFWNHIVFVTSFSKEKYTEKLMLQFAEIFLNFVDKSQVYKIFDSMIFHCVRIPNNGINFICDLLHNLNDNYISEYYKNIELTFQKVIDRKILPLPSFWGLFNSNYFSNLLEKNNSNPIFMYAYLFSYEDKNPKPIQNITIVTKLNANNRDLIKEFIIKKDFDFLAKTNEDVLSLITSALIFAKCKEKPEVKGLNKETILPFFAIAFNYIADYEDKSLIFESPIMLNQLIMGSKFLSRNNSLLLTTSIDSILLKNNFFCNNNFFPTNATFQILNILIPLLIKNLYRANKNILLSLIFYLSTQIPLKNEMKSLFQNHGINLFKFIISNVSLMKYYDKVNSIDRLNLDVFNQDKIKQIIIENIQNSTSKETVFNTIYFIEKFCCNIPKLNISNFQKIIDILNENITEKQWENCLLICEFLKNHNFISILQQFSDKPLHFSIKEKLFNDFQIETDDLISILLDDPNPETHYLPFEILFKNLMKDESIGLNYFICLFEKVTKEQTLNLLLFLNIYSDKYNDYKYVIIKALFHSYDYHSQSQTFVRKTEIKKIKKSKIGESIVSKLLKEVNQKPDNLQAFFCLYNIASSFPFLFDENPIEIFESILPSLNYLYLFFSNERNNENDIINIKTAITAFLFLYKSLYSIKVINTFVNWFFKNYKKFTDFQILAFTFIFKSLSISKKVKKALLSLFIKYNLPMIMNELLQKQVQENISLYYRQNILILLTNYYKCINNLTKPKIIFIDEIRKIDNPFNIVFNNFSTIFPSDIKEIEIPLLNDDENNLISNFLSDANDTRNFWLSFFKYDDYEDIEPYYDKFDDIVSQYQKLQNNKSNEINLDSLPFIECENSMKVIRYLSTKSNWIYHWILNDITFPLLSEQNNLLINIINEINQFAVDDDIDVYDSDININDYFLEEYINAQLFHFLIYNASNTVENLFDLICNLISSIAENKISFHLLFTHINSFMSHQKYDVYSINKLILMLMKIENDEFKNKFVNECGVNLIKIALKSDFRNDSNILSDLADLLCSINNELPLITTHLIGFMFLLNQQHVILKALILCGKFEVDKLTNIIEIIEKAFDRELNNKNPSYSMIKNFLERIPSLGKSRKTVLTEMLNKAINLYKSYNDELIDLDEEDEKEKENEELICSIINSFAPERNNDIKITPSDLNEIDFSLSISATKINAISKSNLHFLENQIAPKLVKTDPFFWNLYKKHINIIDEIIDTDHKMLSKLNFLIKYPEIMNFKTRSLYFKEKMNKRINNNKILSISIKRSNVLMSSFKQLNKISTNEWMNKITVDFLGEDGIDSGGLTSEWFTLIIKEIFDPKNHLFKSTENESYQPNPTSSQNKNHIELFKFAGKIIARALIQDQYVNAHLTRSFIRQILHRQVKFKDLEDFDKDIYKSMNTILENDVDSFYLNFTINIDNKESIELKENGQNIDLTNENKQEYVSLYTHYHLRKSIIEQINAFSEGFDSLINQEDINIFTPGELDLMICGIPDIDVEDMKKYTEYEYPYHEKHPVVVLFFKVISKWNNDNLAKFLIFLTGSSQVPVNGFKDYQDRGKPIIIASGGDRDRLCVAHTCFNTLDLPKYETEEEMNEKLILSIQECEFGIL